MKAIAQCMSKGIIKLEYVRTCCVYLDRVLRFINK